MNGDRRSENESQKSTARAGSCRSWFSLISELRRSFGPRNNPSIGSRKRVRLADHCEENCLGFREDEATTQEGAGVRISDVPKTSEYAFFKKLKENKGHRFNSRSVQNEATPITKFISDHNPSTSTHVIDGVHKESGLSLLHQDVTPKNFTSLQAPACSVSRKSGTSYSYKCGEVFPKKRENLLLWVKTTSFPEIDELLSKGILQILIGDSSMSSKLHAYPQSGIQLKEFNHNCTWDFLEAEGGQYLYCSLSSGWLYKSMERIIPDYLPAVAALKTVTWQEYELQAPNKSLIEEETRNSEWGWVLDNKNNERDLNLVHQSRELTTAPALLTYWCDDRQQTLESGCGGRELSAFSVSSHYPSKFLPIAVPSNKAFTTMLSKRIMTRRRYSLSLMGAEDHDFDDSYAVLSPPEQDQFTKKGFSERHYHPLTDGFMHSLKCDSDLRMMCFSSPVSSLGDHIFTGYTHRSPQVGEVLLSFLCGEDWYKRLKKFHSDGRLQWF